MIILHLGKSMFQAFTYKIFRCKKNENFFYCIDLLTIKTVHEIIEISKDKNLELKLFFDICMINWQLINRRIYYYGEQSNGSSIVR